MLCALCAALSAAVQFVFSGFKPYCTIYFSIFICTVCCPMKYGIFCAVLCPLISMMTAGNPAAVLLPAGIAKCLVFSFLSRLMFVRFRTGKLFNDMYICLVPAVCAGQITGAVINSAIFCGDANSAVMFAVEQMIAAIPESLVLLAIAPGTVSLLNSLGIVEKHIKSENI